MCSSDLHLRLLGVRPSSWGSGILDVQGNGEPFTITLELAPLPSHTEAFVQLYSAQEPR